MAREIKGYLANQFGFSETGMYILDNLIKPRIREIGIIIHDPFIECAKELDLNYLEKLDNYGGRKKYLEEFSKKVTPINNGLMQDSDCLIAILDGGHVIDDGVASEIGYYAGIRRGPIFALRSDFRLGENMAVLINPQVEGYIALSQGYLASGKNSLGMWFEKINDWHKILSSKLLKSQKIEE